MLTSLGFKSVRTAVRAHLQAEQAVTPFKNKSSSKKRQELEKVAKLPKLVSFNFVMTVPAQGQPSP